jgi:hypothetical protein
LTVVQRDHEGGARVERTDAGEQASGRRGVKALGGLVEKKDVGPPQQGRRDAEAAALAARERCSAGTDRSVEPGWEGGDGVVERRGGKGLQSSRSPAAGSASPRLSRMARSKTCASWAPSATRSASASGSMLAASTPARRTWTPGARCPLMAR